MGADFRYATWDNAPDSMKLEIENLWKYIHTLTHTPDISFEQMKGIGAVSGVALELLFMDAHMKASDSEELFGEFVQRRINFLKAAIAINVPPLQAATTMTIKPKFEYFKINNIPEQLQSISTAVISKVISQETAVKLTSEILGIDSDEEVTRVLDEAEAAATAANAPNALDLLMNS